VISFVIPAYNEERWIGATLAALRESATLLGEPYEIIMVDDDSTDCTAAIAAECGAEVVRVSRRQIAATRNAGALAARGDQLVFVDADTRVHPALLRAAVEALRSGIAGGGAPIRFDGKLPRYYGFVESFLLWLQRTARFAGGCFLFCSRSAFEAVGGFDERMYGGEEIALSQALKRHGRFVILRESVLTSGRKLRTHSGREILRLVGLLLTRGRRAVESREGLEMWYGPRREDPERKSPSGAASA
jgi:glycosyltransferase involved in cell wall biosynthesis